MSTGSSDNAMGSARSRPRSGHRLRASLRRYPVRERRGAKGNPPPNGSGAGLGAGAGAGALAPLGCVGPYFRDW
jgi:hypothetical protein